MQELLWIEMNNKWYKTEALFTTAWLKWLKAKWYFVHKISDAWRNLKPYDCIICTTERFYWCEVKIIDKDLFTVDQLRPNQQAALTKMCKLWADKNAIVCVYSKHFNKYTIIPYINLIKEK